MFNSVLRLITVGKFRRAPFGRGKFWNELKSAVTILLETTQGHSPVIDHFAADICADYGVAAHSQTPEAMCELLKRLVVHGIGPGVTRGAPGTPPALGPAGDGRAGLDPRTAGVGPARAQIGLVSLPVLPSRIRAPSMVERF